MSECFVQHQRCNHILSVLYIQEEHIVIMFLQGWFSLSVSEVIRDSTQQCINVHRWFWLISYWIYMDLDGFTWIFMDLDGFTWIYMDLYGSMMPEHVKYFEHVSTVWSCCCFDTLVGSGKLSRQWFIYYFRSGEIKLTCGPAVPTDDNLFDI